ncbi:PRTRC system protein D [Paraburkholderia tuberum]|uniref:Plasmid segregation actin-type ATPase ParM n=1 Tax=Paraburkholderia tuberum TaxID=157910 RepID=A0A1H1KKQ0_9BURK|nr:PRTRC system protein D [Paraburkholderia tuberum]SDR62816.1 plasmid segregation actin-type ATPase ParM [Paraburkholderia tuberum]
MKVSVFAVDVGYGNTKSAFRMGSDIATQMFPSVAPIAVSDAVSSYGQGVLHSRKVLPIEVDGATYEIGPGVELSSAYGNAGRTLSEDFCLTANYAALLGGSLQFAGVTEVERMVLGLPVHTINKFSAHLRDAFTGTLNFGHGDIRIHSVKVVPQPLGSLVSFSEYGGSRFDRENAHMVIDVGYFTTDWVVAHGFTMNDRRSGGAPGGASQVYKSIASLIAKNEKEPVDDIERIDKCLREKKPLLFYGKDIDLISYLDQSQAIINSTVKEMQNRVGRTADLRSIVLTGGGAALYEPAIRAAFPRVQLDVLDAPCYANAKGFLIVGEATLARERKALGVAA